MTTDEARILIRNHARADASFDGILHWLRPYRGLNGVHLVEIIEAVHALGPVICSGAATDREVVANIWNLCFTVRCWTCGPHEPMFHGRNFIAPEDKMRLDDWLYHLEHWVILLLNTNGQPHSFDWHLFKRLGLAHLAVFALPFILRDLREAMDVDPHFTEDNKIPDCEVLAAIGPVALPAVELLEQLARVTRSSEVREAALATLSAIRFEQR